MAEASDYEIYVEGILRLDLEHQRQMSAYEHADVPHDQAVRQIAQDMLDHTGFVVQEASDR